MAFTATRTATEEARRAKNIDGKPPGSTVCRRCTGYGGGEAWEGTGRTCFRCSGHGYCLNGEDLAALCAKEAREFLPGIEAGGKEWAAALERLPASHSMRPIRTRQLETARSEYRRYRNAARALEALSGTSPNLTQVRRAAGKITSLPTTRR